MSAQRIDLRPPEDAPARGARIFIHPSCTINTPRFELLCDGFEKFGLDMEQLSIEHRGLGLMDQLVRKIEATPTRVLYERFDGTRFSKEIANVPEQVSR